MKHAAQSEATGAPEPAGQTAVSMQPPDTDSPLHILVVDDEPDIEPLVGQLFRCRIRTGEYVFRFARNGRIALEEIERNPLCALVITDINMPVMDGLELLRRLSDRKPEIESIVVSAYGDIPNIRTAMNRGAFDFVTKPIDFDDLAITVERAKARIAERRRAEIARERLIALRNEIRIASKLQQGILPATFPRTDDYEIHATMIPAHEVGGDFYDVTRLQDGRISVAVADVSDKGVPAALFMVASRMLLKGAAIGMERPGMVLEEVNRLLHEDNAAFMFVTLVYVVYDPGAGTLAYANGGHCDPVVVATDGTARTLPSTGGMLLGLTDHVQYDERQVRLDRGETLILYTDGVTEAERDGHEEFGHGRLLRIFSGHGPKSARDAVDRIMAAVTGFAEGNEQRDDITCLALHRKAK